MPIPLLAAGGLAALLTQLFRYLFLAHIASFIARALGVLGLAWFTNEVIVDPVLDMIRNSAGGVPADLAAWLDAFGIDEVISIVASAYTLLSAKRVFLGKNA